jgi:hypothetical protein
MRARSISVGVLVRNDPPDWLDTAVDTHGVAAYNLVGGASSANQYNGRGAQLST